MRFLAVILLLALSACTTVTYKGEYGEVYYTSYKDVEAALIKEGNNVTLTVKGDNGGKMELFKGMLETIK